MNYFFALSLLVQVQLSALNAAGNSAWGFFAHQQINRIALFTLPAEIFTFYKENIEFITEHAVDPDKRRYAIEGEAPRHFIDIDHYKSGDIDPFENVPVKWKDAAEKFSEDTLMKHGIVPWHIERMFYRLTKAFNEEDFDFILRTSSDLGHYIGDAHVPLHTTENYNGQLTGQHGIHGFWESRIPELFAGNYDFFVGKAFYIEDPLEFAWKIVRESHAAVDSVLVFEKELTKQFGDKKYSYETRGNATVKVYSLEFSSAYNDLLNGMVERRMRQAIIAVGSAWYSCWVNAGKPDLVKHKGNRMSEKSQEEISGEENEFTKGNKKGRACEH